MSDMDIIDQVEAIRSENNTVWMELMRLALERAPGRAKEIIRVINENDKKISELLEELAKP